MLFSVLYGIWIESFAAFDGDVVSNLAAQFLALAEKQGATVSLMVGHRLLGMSLLMIGDIAEGRAHLDRAIALYDPVEHRPLATRFGVDIGVSILAYRSLALWVLGYAEAALVDAKNAVGDARDINHSATLMYALHNTSLAHICCGNYGAANTQLDEVVSLADQKGAPFWKAGGASLRGGVLALAGKASDAVPIITSGVNGWRSTGASVYLPMWLSYLARAYAELGQRDKAWYTIDEAITATKTSRERWCEAEVHRVAGDIELKSSTPDAAKAEDYFERALSIAREQQAKSWELRAAMSMARLWRDQGKRQQAHDLLAPVYGWFTEGFDTLDLKEAKSLLEQLKA